MRTCGELGLERVQLLLGLVDVVERYPADGDLEQALDVLVGDLPLDLLLEGLEAVEDGLPHALLRLHLLDRLVDALLDEYPLERARVDLVQELARLELELALEDVEEAARVVLDDVGRLHEDGQLVLDHEEVAGYRLLALGEGVEGVHHLGGVDAALELDLDLDLVGGEVRDRGYLDASRLGGGLDAGDETLGGGAEGQLPDEYALLVGEVELGADADLALAVLVLGGVAKPARGKVGIELEAPALERGYLGLDDLDGIVGKDARAHADGYALGAHHEDDGNLGGEDHGLAVAAVVGLDELGDLGLVEEVLGEGS